MSERPRCRTAVTGHSGPGLRGHGVNKLSWANPGQVRGPTSSTRCSGRLGPGSEGPQCRPNLLGDSGSRPRSRGSPAVLGEPGPFPRARRFDQLFRPTRTRVRADTRSTSYRGQLSTGSELTRDRPAILAGSDPGPRSCGVDQLSQQTRSRVRTDTWSTSYPAPSGPGSELTRCPSAVPSVSDPRPRSCGVVLTQGLPAILTHLVPGRS